ncbi:hypothetical protein RhiirB3_392863 [Rhizophagus irregularis]|nr:hypothetical protein RhiirB3_392863 [Rhizophagus irregularis]
MARFGKNLVFLAYFKDKDQLDAAKALDKGADDTWIIHGKGLGNQPVEISKRDSRSDLVSTTPRNNGKVMPAMKIQPIAKPTIIENKVVDIVLDLRAEINKELSQDEKDDEKWIDRCRNGYAALVTDLKERKKKMDEARLERDTLQKELEVVHTKVNENQKILDKIKSEKRDKAKSNENTKQVSPLELHEYESINETCSKRLDEKKNKEPICTPEYMERRQAQRDNYRKVFEAAKEAAEQWKRLRKTQGDRVKEEEGIESDSDEEEEDQVVVSTEAHNKRGENQVVADEVEEADVD